MFFDKIKSKKFLKFKEKPKFNLLKITGNLYITITLLSTLSGCSTNTNDLKHNDITSLYEKYDDNKLYINALDSGSNEFDEEYYNLYNNGYIILEENGAYSIHRISDLILIKNNMYNINLIDLANNNRDIFTDEKIDNITSKNMLLLKRSNILYNIYLNNVENIVNENNKICLKVNKDELKGYVDKCNFKEISNVVKNVASSQVKNNNIKGK